jgi:hypothetical protein
MRGDAVSVIDVEAAKRRRQGFTPMQAGAIDLKVYDNLDGRAYVGLTLPVEVAPGVVESQIEELLLVPETLRAWAKKMLTVADQIDAPAPRLALVEEA